MSQVGRAIFCLLLLVAVVLSGCSSSDDPTTKSTSKSGPAGTGTSSKAPTTGPKATSTGPGGSGGSGGGGGGSGSNNPPTGGVSASITQGAIPVNVTFSLTGNDQDGDPLTWNIDFDGDGKTDSSGTALPASTNHNYTTVGSFNVTYTVSDDKGGSHDYFVTINATAAAGGTGAIQVISGSYTAGDWGLCAYGSQGSGGTAGATSGVSYLAADLSPGTVGHSFETVYTLTAPAAGLAIGFPDSGGGFAGGVSDFPSPGSTTLSGSVPDGAVAVQISSCGGGGATVVMTIT